MKQCVDEVLDDEALDAGYGVAMALKLYYALNEKDIRKLRDLSRAPCYALNDTQTIKLPAEAVLEDKRCATFSSTRRNCKGSGSRVFMR